MAKGLKVRKSKEKKAISASGESLAQQSSIQNRKWSRGFLIVVASIYIINKFYIPVAPVQVKTAFNTWLSLTSMGEIMVFILMALGLNIVVGYAGLLDLGYVAFWALGGYVAGWLMSGFFDQVTVHVGGNPAKGLPNGIHLNVFIVLIAGGIFTAIWGVIIGAPTLRLKSDYLALVTLGFGEIIPQFMVNGENIGGFNMTNGSKGINPVDNIKFFGFEFGPFALADKFLLYSALAGMMIFLSLRLRDGRLGRAWLAIREDELAASMMGVPLMRTKLASYAVGATAGGVGGVAFATLIGGVYAERFNFAISIIILSMVVLGGMGNVWGVMVGATLLAWINNTGLVQIGKIFNAATGMNVDFPSFNFLIFGVLLVLMMLFRREGFIPEARVRLIMHEEEFADVSNVTDDIKLEGHHHHESH
ncbi:MAG: branched-chain amino acid ABC transporter permease [Actinomycetes bacterium]